MHIGYLRVSTEEQSTARQEDSLKAICDEYHIERLSAAAKNRPEFDEVIAKLKPGDTFVVHDLDRAFRSSREALNVLADLQKRGVNFRIINVGIDAATPEGELLYTIIAAVATFERRFLSRRTKEGMAAAKARGVHIGRPRKKQAEPA